MTDKDYLLSQIYTELDILESSDPYEESPANILRTINNAAIEIRSRMRQLEEEIDEN
jgi:hypothetical protein